MKYHFSLKKSPQTLLFPGFSTVLVIASLVLSIFVNLWLGLVLLALSLFVSWHLLKAFLANIRSCINVSDSGISGLTALGSEFDIPWDALSLAGTFTCPEIRLSLFLYDETADFLIRTVPVYEDFTELIDEVRARADDFIELNGTSPASLEAELRNRFATGGK